MDILAVALGTAAFVAVVTLEVAGGGGGGAAVMGDAAVATVDVDDPVASGTGITCTR